jgi:hypothetical protein
MEDLTGKQFGSYQIVAPLGEGGMAAVYKAYQPAMERYVALKVLPRHFADDPQFVTRFKQEAKVLAQLQHPHILPVFDFGEFDEYTYLVMPFVKSGTLTDELKGEPFPIERIDKVIAQIGGALDYAHERGLIHRDVKPSNVLIDESGNYLLSDFGLAKILEGNEKLTMSGVIMGTPAYMSPEQGMGKTLDGRSDIYSLGVILYEMATGRAPYKAETPMAVMIKHISDPLPPPSIINSDLPEEIEAVILKALAKNPEDRYQSAGELVRALSTTIRKAPSAILARSVNPAAAGQQVVRSEAKPTYDVRKGEQQRENTNNPIKLREWISWGIAGATGLLLLGFIVWQSSQIRNAQAHIQETGTALLLTDLAITRTAGRPTNTPEPTNTLDLYVAATQLGALTQTQAAFEASTQSVVLTVIRETNSAQETIVALTPTSTMTSSPTPTRKPIPTRTPAPIPTATPQPSISAVINLSPGGCSPNTASAGVVVFFMGMGRWDSEEIARVAVGVFYKLKEPHFSEL